ncbi:autotransporter-associated beta strand repeat-containing protein [Brucella sp. 1315]|nr:autotransporter-associated beta strand repeat-containing protein [Brucella sp. 1315]UWF68756.1 autotransporter-associated beta strand repeat-containing protein [Brucella sp. 1315]
MTLSGANSYTGATTVTAGTLTLTGDNTGGGTTTVDVGALLPDWHWRGERQPCRQYRQ